MNQKNIDNKSNIADPEFFTIALSILTIITPIGVLIAEQTIGYFKSEKERKEEIRNALYESYRALNEAERLLKDFVSFLAQQGFLDRDFRLGKAPLAGVPAFIRKYLKTL